MRVRILIVDDNLLIRSLLRSILTAGGHDVVGEAENGVDALRQYELLKPDLVTLDLVMPGEHGLAVLLEFQRIDPLSVVVVCSAHLTERRVLTAIDLGASGFISKPFDRNRVLDALDAAVSSQVAVAGCMPERSFPVDEQDRREFERVRVALPVVLMPPGKSPVRTVTTNISGNGLAVAEVVLKLDQKLRFSLRLGPGGRRVQGWARVARMVPGEGQALRIEEVSVSDHERMINYIRSRHQELPGHAERSPTLS